MRSPTTAAAAAERGSGNGEIGRQRIAASWAVWALAGGTSIRYARADGCSNVPPKTKMDDPTAAAAEWSVPTGNATRLLHVSVDGSYRSKARLLAAVPRARPPMVKTAPPNATALKWERGAGIRATSRQGWPA